MRIFFHNILLFLFTTVALITLIVVFKSLNPKIDHIEVIEKTIISEKKSINAEPNNENALVFSDNENAAVLPESLIVSEPLTNDSPVEKDTVNNSLLTPKNETKEALSNKKNQLLSVADINDFIIASQNNRDGDYEPLISMLLGNEELRTEWLNWLISAENNEINENTKIILGNLSAEDLTDFASRSLVDDNENLIAATLGGLFYKNELEGMNNELTDAILYQLQNDDIDVLAKMQALEVVSKDPENYTENQKMIVTQSVTEQLYSEDTALKNEAINSMIKLDPEHNELEDIVLVDIIDGDIHESNKALLRLDYQLELGLKLTPEAVTSIYQRVLLDMSNDNTLEGDARERYVETGSYILGSLDLTEDQIVEMQQFGINYTDHREKNEDENIEPQEPESTDEPS